MYVIIDQHFVWRCTLLYLLQAFTAVLNAIIGGMHKNSWVGKYPITGIIHEISK